LRGGKGGTFMVGPGRHVARNFDRGANNNEVSTFKYIMPLDFKASSTKGVFFRRYYSE